jgi:uncharacterized membrane protein
VDGLEASLAHVLQIGSYASIALVTAGVLLLAAGGVSPLDPGPALDLGRIPSDLVVATPGLRVALALVGFARRGERLMVLVAALILVVVAVGVLAGLVTG